jgi:hypothetical protein
MITTSAKKSFLSLAGMLLLIGLNTVPATAGGASYDVFLTAVDARSDGNFSVVISQGTAGTAACATSSSTQMTGKTTALAGQQILALAVAAYLSGKKIGIEGTGFCNEYPGYESIFRIVIVNN